MITAELRADIRRKFFGEHWKVGTIASTLGVHHETVARAIEVQRFANSVTACASVASTTSSRSSA